MTILNQDQWKAIKPDHHSLWGDLRGVSFSQGWIDAGGIETRYLHSGDKSRPPLILLHGVGGHAEAYIRNLGAHGQHFSTWAIDMIGHGWSSKPDHDYEIEAYIGHLAAFIDAIGAEKIYLSGESLGGWVAARFAARYPEKVERLVLNTMGGSKADPAVMERLKTLTTLAATDPSWAFIKARVEWLMFDKKDATDDLIASRQAIYQQPNMARTVEHLMVLQDLEIRLRNLLTDSEYAAIQSPTMVLWTSHDPSGPPEEGAKIASKIPGAVLKIMQDCGHWPQWEKPEEFDRLHLDFLLGRG
jgi:2-hydroxy-6-oxonona-2,4-dienedioate hydrolase